MCSLILAITFGEIIRTFKPMLNPLCYKIPIRRNGYDMLREVSRVTKLSTHKNEDDSTVL